MSVRATEPAAPDTSDLVAGAAGGLEWSFNPWRERPGASALAAVLALGMCAAIMSLRESTVLTVGLVLAAIASLSPLLSPARCRVDAAGAARGGPFGWDRRAWTEIRRASVRPTVLVLSPYAARHWLDGWRAMFLPLPASERDRLVGELQPLLERHGF